MSATLVLSTAQVECLRRVFANVARSTPLPQHTQLRTSTRVYCLLLAGAGEQFLLARHWQRSSADEALHWVGDEAAARNVLFELAGPRRASSLAMAQVRAKLEELTSRGLWFFPSVFRFSASEFASSHLGAVDGVVLEDVEAALCAVVDAGQGAALGGRGHLTYTRDVDGTVTFCYAYQP